MNKYTLHITASGPGVNITATAEGQGLNLADAMDNMQGMDGIEAVSREQVEACTEITMRVIKVPDGGARRIPKRKR